MGAKGLDFYDADAARLRHDELRGFHHEVRYARLMRALAARPAGGRWLDVPSGDGVYSAALGRSRRVVAADLSGERLRRARERGVALAVQADLSALPFRDGVFDGALCLEAIEHLERPEAAVRELARVVRPGGDVVIETPSRTNLWNLALEPLVRAGLLPRRLTDWGLRMDPGHVRFYTEAQVRALAAGAGLAVTRVVGAPVLRWNLGLLRPLTDRTPLPRLLEAALARVPRLRATGMIQQFWCRVPPRG